MATNTLNTRVVICSKTTSQWANVTTVPLKGEICIEWISEDSNTLPKMKVGNGTDVYAGLPYATFTEKEIKAFISQAAFNLQPATASALGGVKIGSNVNVTTDGTISIPVASATSATAGTAGVMSVADKNKLNNIEAGADATDFIVQGTDDSDVYHITNGATVKLNNSSVALDGTSAVFTIDSASTSKAGIVQLSDSTSSDSSTTAATSKAVKEAYDKANSAVSTVKQDGVTGATVNRFGTCSIAAATAAKTVSITTGTFALEAGAKVTVKFNNANTASSPTLNVNGTGAKNIFHNGAQITSGVNKGLLAGVCDFVYDGTQWHLVGNYHDTTYSTATTSANGLMSSTDKSKLNTLDSRSYINAITDGTNTAGIAAKGTSLLFDNTSIDYQVGSDDKIIEITPKSASTSQKGIVQLNSATNSTSTSQAATPSAVKSAYDLASAAMPKSGGTFTGAVTLNADPTADLGAATKQYVDTQITSKIAASDALVYRGTLGTGGTVTALPTSGVVKGDCYKVLVAATYAEQAAKVGDLYIALNSGNVTATAANWTLIESGNENETFLRYSTTTTNLTTTAQSGTITLAEGATKQVDTSLTTGTTSTKLPTSKAVVDYIAGKNYITSSATVSKANQLTNSHDFSITGAVTAAKVSFNGTQDVALNATAVSTTALYIPNNDVLIIDGNFS